MEDGIQYIQSLLRVFGNAIWSDRCISISGQLHRSLHVKHLSVFGQHLDVFQVCGRTRGLHLPSATSVGSAPII